MLNFWETVRGTRLADTLIRELPKLAAKNKQRIMLVNDSESVMDLREALEDGERIVTSFQIGDSTYVVLEKEGQ